jgi:hypothetical protein
MATVAFVFRWRRSAENERRHYCETGAATLRNASLTRAENSGESSKKINDFSDQLIATMTFSLGKMRYLCHYRYSEKIDGLPEENVITAKS